jgi:hydroxymethylpyrimidine/phosphomethylpyrimidine kinase
MKKVLTIAGSDSGGGAGIQADLKTFSARGVFGMSAVTALTAQNTIRVQGILEIDKDFVGQQIDSVMTDIGADAWKTGMLSNAETINTIANRAKFYEMELIIVDPVMIAKSGDSLLKIEAKKSLISELIPLSYVVTPNRYEAQELAGMEITNLEQAREASIKIFKMGAKNVVIKGGHIFEQGDAIDLLFDGEKFTEFHAQRIKTQNTHGTGCTYASAIAAELAKGNEIKKAIHIAKAYITTAIQLADELHVGKGHGPTDHSQRNIVEVDLDLIKIKTSD